MKNSSKGVKTVLVVCVLCLVSILVTVIMSVVAGNGKSGIVPISPATLAQSTEEKTQEAAETTKKKQKKTTEQKTETTAAPTTEATTAETTTEETTTVLVPYTQDEPTTAMPTTVKDITEKSSSGRIVVDPRKVQWNLIVVNSSREIPEGYVPQLKEILGSGKYLDYRVAPHYEDMYYAAKKDGITLTPYSAYRTYERQ